MSLKMNANGFGTKGADQRPMTFAESLLSGRAIGRSVAKPTPTLKGRTKAKFGKKSLAETFSVKVEKILKRRGAKFWAGLVVGVILASQALAGMFNLPSPTFGGRQVWTDVRVQGGWRVQCHALTGHCRVLDENDVRRTWGTKSDMIAALDQYRAAGDVQAPRSDAVVLVHGLGRSAHSFDKMAQALRDDGFEVVAFNYASTRGNITQHAAALNHVLDGLKGSTRVSFVTHSLGAIVVRQALNSQAPWRDHMDLGATVMLAPPNQGSQVARSLSGNVFADAVFGPALTELAATYWGKRLPVLTPFAIVAGTHSILPFISDEGDGLVSVDETRLNGAARHVSVDATHTFVMDNADAIAFTKGFLAASV